MLRTKTKTNTHKHTPPSWWRRVPWLRNRHLSTSTQTPQQYLSSLTPSLTSVNLHHHNGRREREKRESPWAASGNNELSCCFNSRKTMTRMRLLRSSRQNASRVWRVGKSDRKGQLPSLVVYFSCRQPPPQPEPCLKATSLAWLRLERELAKERGRGERKAKVAGKSAEPRFNA